MTRFRAEQENDDGWTDWIHPLPGYKLACCDCGLVHNMQFRIDDLGQINFRAQRNVRSTAQVRRHKGGVKLRVEDLLYGFKPEHRHSEKWPDQPPQVKNERERRRTRHIEGRG